MPELQGSEPSFRGHASLLGRTEVSYNPVRADTSRGFGAWEVHPEKVPGEENGSLCLKLNGHWRAQGPEGAYPMRYYVFKPQHGGREAAEAYCASQNGDLPTRVIDMCGEESVSEYTAERVQAMLDAKSSTQ